MENRGAELDTVIIGAGVVGLAIARQLAQQGQSVAVLELEAAPGQHTSSRNSGVIHAGFYYPHDSHKARLCVRGKSLLYAFCAEHRIAHRNCGKLVVANNEQEAARLHTLLQQGPRNGVNDLEIWDDIRLAREEPALRANLALYSPSTGIVDATALLQALEADLMACGGLMVCHSEVRKAEVRDGLFEVTYRDDDGTHILHCEQLVNAAGLWASTLAQRLPGHDRVALPQTRLARGNYFSLAGPAPSQRLVYPAPGEHGLGIHLTLDLDGQARFGPDVEWVDDVDYRVSAERHASFVAAIQRYWPALEPARLSPAWAGVRPKAWQGDAPLNDFVLMGPEQMGLPGLVQLFGIESPGLTACLAIAETVSLMLASPADPARALH